MRGSVAALSFVAACLCAPSAIAQTSDPWEGTNRDLFAAHEAIDQAVLEPVARGYRAVTPGFVRTGVTNFLGNLKSPVIFINDVLQAEPSRAGTTVARFGINSTVGLLGLFDPATSMGLERHDEDFGQTLAVWGVESGPYLFIPVLGPTTVRDSAGRVIDMAFDPLNWATFDEADEARAIRGGLTALSVRESLLDQVDEVRENAIDPYVTFRSTYELLRESAIRNGPTDVEELPDFDAVSDFDAAPVETQPEAPQIVPEASASTPGVNQ
ncbi:MAG: VacJ family lipoprotein [Hyphomonadaceae bacterium]|nr:VacJ family lipoprotein [Hyphomonadaceae bacterium]